MEVGGEFGSVGLEDELLHLLGGWRECCSDNLEDELLHLIWRMEENIDLMIWSSICFEDGGESCSDLMIWRMSCLITFWRIKVLGYSFCTVHSHLSWTWTNLAVW